MLVDLSFLSHVATTGPATVRSHWTCRFLTDSRLPPRKRGGFSPVLSAVSLVRVESVLADLAILIC